MLAEHGEPFLRIGPDGVEANLASPSWYLTNQPFGAGQLPAERHRPTPAAVDAGGEETPLGLVRPPAAPDEIVGRAR